ncbi:MAG: GAF domain-containing protein [Candidatus Aminicenantes bacterium]|nr:GAF domain-containing protein [Candidatus Aminicenantes bacterium]NIQ67094.1 GAF domain-containing protein [Candidatus Aminicenantes bacterium]NIT22776.1 GAF domain-containing protein [Candidatus Aminicenantes bacterium]
MKKAQELLDLVYEIGLMAHQSQDLKAVLQSISERILKETHAFFVAIGLVDEARQEAELSVGVVKNGGTVPLGYRQPINDGIVGKAMTTGQLIYIKDTSKSEEYVNLIPGTKSELAIPLFLGGKLIGVLNVESEHVGHFGPEDIALLQAIANPVALAIENARLYQEEKKRQKQMATLNQLNRVLTSTVDVDALLDRVVEAIREQLNYPFVGIGLPDKDSKKLVLKAISSIHPVDLPIGHTQDIGVGVVGEVMATGKSLLVPDVRKRENYVPMHKDFLCEMCCPLRVGDRLVGCLNAEDHKTFAFNEDDLVVFETIADHIAQAVENAENLRRMNQMREDLSHMVVHDLRNPLSVIYSSLDMLGMSESLIPETKKKRYLDTARACCDQLILQLDSLLEIHKIETGRLELYLEILSPDELVSRAIDSLTVKAELSGKSISSDKVDPLPKVNVDRELFFRVLQNLVMNALKFTKRGGHIHVSVRRAAKNVARKYLKNGGVLFSVRDDGCGIPADKLEHIFEKFTTLKSQHVDTTADAGTDPLRGAGLGLTFCRLITLAHKGAIWAESELGKGSTFHVLLPSVTRDSFINERLR